MESKALVKSTNINAARRFFARTPSRILRMVNICEVVDVTIQLRVNTVLMSKNSSISNNSVKHKHAV